MEAKSRIRNLSTRYFRTYKYGVVLLTLVAIGFFVLRALEKFKQSPIETLGMTGMWISIIFLWNWIRIHKKVYQVEFDEDYLYIIRGNQDTIIPLENIKDVQIKSLVGFYQIDLYSPEDFGSQLYFKPSLLYPLNFKKKDALVDALRKNVVGAKRKVHPDQKNALRS